ncbi:MAG: alpha/beta fold hydrolase [Betaproteobacteria bacterium]|nr:alpha/beta fold hydrolase [Betaproteobacteria bacterium]
MSARMIETHHLPGLVTRDLFFDVPLDYSKPDRTIRVFARELARPDQASRDLPYLVFFQGGPGFGSPRPTGPGGWIGRALADYRVLLLDQRGTGRSTPLTAQMLDGMTPEAQATYVMQFRADNIVRDAESIRQDLSPNRPWSILGQSYGGFCSFTYLSMAPQGLKEVFVTGGVPSLNRHVDDIYRACYPRVIEKNKRYFERYPGDRARVNDIVAHLSAHRVELPGGGLLTPRRFQQAGIAFGMSDGFETVHYLIEDAFIALHDGTRALDRNFLVRFEHAQAFDTNPIYTLLHEGCYVQDGPTNWSAQRILAEFAEFRSGEPLFTGEMVFPWMLEDYTGLTPLKQAADIIARHASWPLLYDATALSRNSVPTACAVYYDDLYVPREFSEETARDVPNVQLWITSEYEHNGLRADGAKILDRLIGMVRGTV